MRSRFIRLCFLFTALLLPEAASTVLSQDNSPRRTMEWEQVLKKVQSGIISFVPFDDSLYVSTMPGDVPNDMTFVAVDQSMEGGRVLIDSTLCRLAVTPTYLYVLAAGERLFRKTAQGPLDLVFDLGDAALREIVADGEQLYFTDDNGLYTLQPGSAILDTLNRDQLHIIHAEAGILYAEGTKILGTTLRSTDGGASFHRVYQPLGSGVRATFANFGGGLFMATQDGTGSNLYLSSDHGVMWMPFADVPGAFAGDLFVVGATGGYVYVQGQAGLFRTDNPLNGWELVTIHPQIVQSVCMSADRLIAASDIGLLRFEETEDAWRSMPVLPQRGYTETVIAFGTTVVLLRGRVSPDEGATWYSYGNGAENATPLPDGTLIGYKNLTWNPCDILRSTNGGVRWQKVASFPGNVVGIATEGSRLWLLRWDYPNTGATLYRSDDEGLHWDSVATTPKYSSSSSITMTISGVDMLTNWPWQWSRDGGASWTNLDELLGDQVYTAFRRSDGSIMARTKSSGYFTVTPDLQVASFTVQTPAEENVPFLQRGDNVFMSDANGIYQMSLRDGSVRELNSPAEIRQRGILMLCTNFLLAGARQVGLWRLPLSQILDAASPKPAPAPGIAMEVAPQPLHGPGMLHIQATGQSDAVVEMHDLLGRSVRTLYRGTITPGTTHAAVPIGGLAPGLYTIHLTTSDESLVQTVLLR